MARIDMTHVRTDGRFVVRHTVMDCKVRFFVFDTKRDCRASRFFEPGDWQKAWDRATFLSMSDDEGREVWSRSQNTDGVLTYQDSFLD